MAKLTNDQIGHAAEVVVELQLLRPVGRRFDRVLFRVTRLGEKYPLVDFLIDALGSNERVLGHCFVQVKGTAGASPTAPRLPIDVGAEQFNRLVRLPIPSYLVAVDVPAEAAYLVAAHRARTAAVASVGRRFPLAAEAVKIDLYREVVAHWARRPRRTSGFTDG